MGRYIRSQLAGYHYAMFCNIQKRTFAEANANPAYICPISRKLMVDPVMTEAAKTYNRDAINKWFDLCKAAGNDTTDPFTQTVVNPYNLVPNNALRSAIGEYLSQIVLPNEAEAAEAASPAKRQRSASEAPAGLCVYSLINAQPYSITLHIYQTSHTLALLRNGTFRAILFSSLFSLKRPQKRGSLCVSLIF